MAMVETFQAPPNRLAGGIPRLAQQATGSPSNHKASLTEVILPSLSGNQYSLVLPMLSHLSNQYKDRWLTWVAPLGIERTQLLEFGFSLESLRIIHPGAHLQTRHILQEALALGNSHTVVGYSDGFNDDDMCSLELAAQAGECKALLLRQRKTH